MIFGRKLENPRARAGFISVVFFWWLHPFLRLSYKKGLNVHDLYEVLPNDSSAELAADLLCEWNRECIVSKETGRSKPSLTKALWRTFKSELLISGVLAFAKECLVRTGQSLILGRLLRSFNDSEQTWAIYVYAAALVLSSVVVTLMEHNYIFQMRHLAMRIRLAVNSIIYQKSLRLSQQAQSDITIWQVINLLSNDSNRFDAMLEGFHFLWISPVQVLIVLGILLWNMGPASLIGTGIVLLFLPLQSWLGKFFSSLRARAAQLSDDRISKMSEILSGIRIIKMYAWEKPFVELVRLVRREEMKFIRKSAYLAAFALCLSQLITKLSLFPTLMVDILIGNSLTAEKTFVAVALFNNIRIALGDEFPEAVRYFVESRVSIQRMQDYLLLEEKIPPAVMKRPHIGQCGVRLDKVSIRWPATSETDRDTLREVSLSVKPGQLVAVVGPVGAGKSSLLHHILGELPAVSGSSKIVGRVAYSPQEAWLFSGTVRQNILCGRAYDPVRYKCIIEACALQKDFTQLARGDLTAVGERGASLSGGQRARISLARALYVDADVYVIDDPLSAVDPRVGNHLFQKCIVEFLSQKIRIVVTHQLQHLQRVDQIVVLKEGRIEATGSYQDLMDRNGALLGDVKSHDLPTQEMNELPSPAVGVAEAETLLSVRRASRSAISLRNRRVSTVAGASATEMMDDMAIYDEECTASGAVSGSIYWKYLRSGSSCVSIMRFFISCLITELLLTGSDYWITVWTEMEESRYVERVNNSTVNSTVTKTFIDLNTETSAYIYSGLTCALLIFMFVRNIDFFNSCTEASVALHNRMFEAVAFTPISFFENNPIGSIFNRFSKDLSNIDETLPLSFAEVIEIFLSVISGLVLICSTVSVWFICPLILTVGPFICLKRFFMKTARSLRRLEAATRSPIYSHVCASLIGLTTLRAHQTEAAFQKMFDDKQDLHSESWYMFIASSGWFATWLDWICNVYVACVTFTCVALRDTMSGSEVGLAITSTIMMASVFEWVVRESAALEAHMISVERVIEYSQLPSEEIETSPSISGAANFVPLSDGQLTQEWPMGDILFDDVSLCYSEDRYVLKNVNCHIKAKEKIGIVGRSGAGKSSIVASLFRLTDHEGHIYIDGVDTKTIGLHRLRSSLYIIPQDPVLFSGTLRSNLDRKNEFADQALWSALDAVNIKERLSANPAGLDALITEGGSNISVGERQLICLARAILRQNRIIVLDEATANVDLKTDSLIQQTIREQFKECTVLTIAHRLNTVMDSDRIMVLEDGYLKEFDEPAILLKNPESFLNKILSQTGESSSKLLISMAQKAYTGKHESSQSNQPESAVFTAL